MYELRKLLQQLIYSIIRARKGNVCMANKFQGFLHLKKLLLMMEADLGIDDLKQDERDILAAIIDIQHDDGSFESDVLKSHGLVARLSHAAFFRALRSLREKGYIEKQDGRQRGFYRLIANAS